MRHYRIEDIVAQPFVISRKRCKAMAEALNRTADTSQPTIYQIRFNGHLGARRERWSEPVAIVQQPDGDTLLTRPVVHHASIEIRMSANSLL